MYKKFKIPGLCIASMFLGAIVAGAVVEYQYEYRYSAGKIAMYSISRECVHPIEGQNGEIEKFSCIAKKSKELSLYTAKMSMVYTYFICKEKNMTDSECELNLENNITEFKER